MPEVIEEKVTKLHCPDCRGSLLRRVEEYMPMRQEEEPMRGLLYVCENCGYKRPVKTPHPEVEYSRRY